MALSPLAFGARLADMQEVDYRNTLAVASLIELLLQKGVITRAELRRISATLDAQAERGAVPTPARTARRFRRQARRPAAGG